MLKNILFDIKTYLSIRLKNPKRFPESKVDSFIPSHTTVNRFCTIKKNVLIASSLKSIGIGTYIGDNTSIYECQEIGNYCSISHGVKIGLTNHPLDHLSTNPFFYDKSRGWVNQSTFSEKTEKQTIIEHDVLISANAMILNGVTLGTGCVVGAGAFVNQDVEPYAIVAGIPAKVIKYRFDPETISKLLNAKWWAMDTDELRKKNANFSNPTHFLNNL